MGKHRGILSVKMLLLLLFFCSYQLQAIVGQSTNGDQLAKRIKNKLGKWDNPYKNWNYLANIKVDSIAVNKSAKEVQLFFNKGLSYFPVREHEYKVFNQSIKKRFGCRFRKYTISIFTDNHQFSELIPNALRKELPLDQKRTNLAVVEKIPIVRRMDKTMPAFGLYNNNIALWPSHGYYYESTLDRWECQRARLFGTVEDMLTTTYILPYLVPMLENAGANVFLPRERDIQINEVIIDNDKSTPRSEFILSPVLDYKLVKGGYHKKDTLFSNENPFIMGTSVSCSASTNNGKVATFVPELPEKGKYAVYVSYLQNIENNTGVKYSVNHLGGESTFLVNQRIGGSTWIYLGTFYFGAGKSPEKGSVIVYSNNNQKGRISIDAVRFGGGMGNVARRPSNEAIPNVKSVNSTLAGKVDGTKINPDHFRWKTSGKPRYMEGARYFLQYSGIPDSLVYSLNKNDYNDDYQSRGAWVNYLIGESKNGESKQIKPGLNIPIDLSFALHSDAGVTANDSVIGTLGIYSSVTENGFFPNGQSKLASRDFTDIVQSQVVDDIRAMYNPKWTRRAMWNRKYSEAVKPNAPSLLLELLSHQNLADMRFGLDPQFRFSVCRSIYKGMLKFQAVQEGRAYVVQPMPVSDFSISNLQGKIVSLSWKSGLDPLEITASPNRYMVYKRTEEGGFDNGIMVNDTSLVIELDEYDKIYSYKVTAINDGGESFPSEILSVGLKSENSITVLVVNGFDRVSAPSFFDSGKMAGISWWDDMGVPDYYEIGFCGAQYDYNRKSEWLDDDSPGWGASYGNMEGKIIPGNSFDYPYIHGEAIMAAGYSFVSTSKKAFCNPAFNTFPYQTTDIILGKEKSTPTYKDSGKYNFTIYTPEFQNKIKEIANHGGSIFMSGAYVGSDLTLSTDSLTKKFAEDVLHFSWRTAHAVKEGKVQSTDYANEWFHGNWNFNTGYHPGIYTVESPDAIEPYGKRAISAFRYTENNTSAGVVFQGDFKTVVLGFPFETIVDKQQRKNLMKQVLTYLKK